MQSLTIFTGMNYEVQRESFNNGSCSGAGQMVRSYSGTFTLGPEVNAEFGTTVVAARQFDLSPSGQHTVYTLLYIDTSATPDRMYLGPDNQAPEHRPTSVLTNPYFEKQ